MYLILIFSLLFHNPTADYETFIKKGDKFHEIFDNVDAAINYEKAYELAPENFEVLIKLTGAYNDAGEEYVELRKRDEAKKYIDKAISYAEVLHKEFPDSAKTYCYLALSYGNIAMFSGSKEKIRLANLIKENAEKSLRMDSTLFVSYVILGIYNREIANLGFFEKLFANTFLGDVPNGSFEGSIKMFNKALSIHPDTIVPTYGLSKTYRYMGEEEKEKEFLHKVLSYKIQNFRDKFAIEKAKRRLERLNQN
jgi:tetratricopeptide (TPR) repeat protein